MMRAERVAYRSLAPIAVLLCWTCEAALCVSDACLRALRWLGR